MDLPAGPAVVLTREAEDNVELTRALTARGVPVVELPCLTTRFLTPELPRGPFDAVLLTSRRGVLGLTAHPAGRAWLDDQCSGPARTLLGAVGAATAAALEAASRPADLVATPPDGRTLARLVLERLGAGRRVAVVRGNLSSGEPERTLTGAGYTVTEVIVYQNSPAVVPSLSPFPVAAVLVASPSAVQRLLEANPWLVHSDFLTIGETTRKAAQSLGASRAQAIGTAPDAHLAALTAAHAAARKEIP